MASLVALLKTVLFENGAQPLVAIDPATRYALVAGKDGPERVDSAFRTILVPLFDWQKEGVSRDDAIVKILVEGSGNNPLKVATPSQVNDAFWVKNRGWRALLLNPALGGKFFVPDGLEVVRSDLVPSNCLILVGLPAHVGFLVQQGTRSGVLTNNRLGLLQVQFSAL